MTTALSTAYLAIASACERNVLRFEPCVGRNGDDYIAICDEVGIIEAAADGKEAEQIVRDAIKAAGGEYMTFDDLAPHESVWFDTYAQEAA